MAIMPRRDERITVCLTTHQLMMIDQAAESRDMSRTAFILDSAYRAAQDAMRGETYFELDDASFDSLLAILESSPEPTQALRDLMAGKYNENDPW